MAFGPHPSFWGKYIVNSFVKMQRLFKIKKLPAPPPFGNSPKIRRPPLCQLAGGVYWGTWQLACKHNSYSNEKNFKMRVKDQNGQKRVSCSGQVRRCLRQQPGNLCGSSEQQQKQQQAVGAPAPEGRSTSRQLPTKGS